LVDAERPGLDAPCDLEAVLGIRRPHAAREPYAESLAIANASFSPAYGITVTTEPKISSRAMDMAFVASAKTVGL
jgi:hypothetical protein